MVNWGFDAELFYMAANESTKNMFDAREVRVCVLDDVHLKGLYLLN